MTYQKAGNALSNSCSGSNKSRKETLNLTFEDISRPGTIEVPRLLEKLSKLQEAVWATGAYLLKEVPKESGRYTHPIHEHCTLTLTGLAKGSTVACMQINEPFGPLWDDDESIGTKTVNILRETVEIIEEDEHPAGRMEELIKDDVYRRRIARSLYNLYPTKEQGGVRVQLGSGEAVVLKPDLRPKFEELMKSPEAGDSATIIGPLIQIDLLKNYIKVWTPRGKISCQFPKEKIREINRYTGQIVEITGPGLFNREGMVKEIKGVEKIKPKSELTLERISSGSIEYPLKHPITVKLDYDLEDKSWTIRNEKLNIIAVGNSWDSALKDFQDQFAYLVEHYRKMKDSALSKGSIARKEELLGLVG